MRLAVVRVRAYNNSNEVRRYAGRCGGKVDSISFLGILAIPFLAEVLVLASLVGSVKPMVHESFHLKTRRR